MGRKHNRRRTRPRYRIPPNDLHHAKPELSISTSPGQASSYQPFVTPRTIALLDRMTLVPAQSWHNRSMSCDIREHRQHHATSKLELEQCRLFGGEPGDDMALCYRMLEYFGGLDYIDT